MHITYNTSLSALKTKHIASTRLYFITVDSGTVNIQEHPSYSVMICHVVAGSRGKPVGLQIIPLSSVPLSTVFAFANEALTSERRSPRPRGLASRGRGWPRRRRRRHCAPGDVADRCRLDIKLSSSPSNMAIHDGVTRNSSLQETDIVM